MCILSKGCLIVHEAQVKARVPFNYLLNNVPEHKDLLCCALPFLNPACSFLNSASVPAAIVMIRILPITLL